jgi:hypothetical protein
LQSDIPIGESSKRFFQTCIEGSSQALFENSEAIFSPSVPVLSNPLLYIFLPLKHCD